MILLKQLQFKYCDAPDSDGPLAWPQLGISEAREILLQLLQLLLVHAADATESQRWQLCVIRRLFAKPKLN